MSIFPPQNLMLVTVFNQFLLVVGDPILLGGFKMGDKAFDQSGLGAIFLGNGADGDFVLYNRHKF